MLESFLKSFKMVTEPIQVISGNMEKYGDTYAVKAGIGKYIVVTQNPGFIEHVLKKNHKNYAKSNIVTEKLGRFIGQGLLTANGEYWLRQRRLIQPGFHKQKVQGLYQIIQNTVDDFLERFPVGSSENVYPLTNKLAFEVVINTLFDIDIPEHDVQELAAIISEVQSYIVKEIRQPYKYGWYVISGEIRKNLGRSGRARQIIGDIVRERKESGKKVNDLLDMLLEVRYEDTGEPMTEEQLVDEILILLVAGHETSANALAWVLFLLAGHQKQLAKLREATANLDIDAAVCDRHLAAVLKEAMRMYPPAWILDRVAAEADEYEEYSYPAGTIVVQFLYGLHHHPTYWADPYAFIPERFGEESPERVVSPAYYPFGGGPRFCIGSGFAMAEMALFLNSFIQRFDIRPAGIAPRIMPLVTLRPDKVLLEIKKIK